ncbi:MAG: coproporphyrinogen III oxidase family protein [Synergistaceae bacterium]|jgi:oxygen-independent coproporphyrinogen-3 oxidase|nr:coproporphyrinogen III oxidase family protein [Synergistaceae bacterium]
MIFSLYLHVPFCVSRCGYCSFYSRATGPDVRRGDALVEAWLAGVGREAERIGRIWEGRPPLRTVYIGGGTPTVLSPAVWARLLRVLEGAFDVSGVREATVEANPCSLTDDHLRLWRDSFVTRVSLGVQSLRDDELSWLGRRHDAREALLAIEKTLAYGFDASADLIFGLPLQTLRTWHDSLHRVVASGVGHVSAYQLTLSPHTPLGKSFEQKNFELPEGYPFYRFAQWYLALRGLAQYEIASFARPGGECLHNLAYWRQENVLALGPSAWGYLGGGWESQERSPDGSSCHKFKYCGGLRYHNVSTLEEYISVSETQLPIAGAERLQGRAAKTEAAILALRTRWGIDAAAFTERWGRECREEILGVLKSVPPRLVRIDESGARLTPAGMRVGNAIWVELMALDD